jgi:hypothetical protein
MPNGLEIESPATQFAQKMDPSYDGASSPIGLTWLVGWVGTSKSNITAAVLVAGPVE